MMQSRKNGQKSQFGQSFDDFDVKYLQIANFSEKQVSFKLKAIFSTNFRPKTKKIITAVFEKNIKVSDFGLIWRPFQEYLQMVTCYIYRPLISCKKSEKSIEPFLRKLRNQATNQPTNANLKTFSRISPNQEFFFQKSGSVTFLLYSLLTSCKKSEKSLEPFLRKLCYQPTNQPITKNTVFLEPD